ncbi:chemotaxis protein CheW [Sphingomonas sp. ac-8]|uniref:chemotaxis protein CheW n=1 Tax=Sphingomonas sp. ac-8 TaxID=3242977 RepID=UPI003A7FB847
MSELYLVARIAGQALAIPSDHVGSVVDVAEITPVPRMPRHLLGLAALRSRVVTVIDTPVLLGLAHSCAGNPRAVVVDGEGHSYALLVDRVEDVVGLERCAPGDAIEAAWMRVARGSVERGGTPIPVVDPAAILALLVAPQGSVSID